jgi:hypothetical protein
MPGVFESATRKIIKKKSTTTTLGVYENTRIKDM